MISRQFNTQIKQLHNDRDKEFKSLETYLFQGGYTKIISCPYNDPQNGIMERRNRHVMETVLVIKMRAFILMPYWDYGFKTPIYLINWMPIKVLNNLNPFELVFKKKLDYFNLRVYGSLCYPYLRPYHKKLESCSLYCIFLSYIAQYKGFWCLEPKSKK